jgi:transaldolase
MTRLEQLRVKIFADGADLDTLLNLYANPLIRGFTTNPTLMNKAGIKDYEKFSRDLLMAIPDRPISLEVFADELDEMERQARKISSWGNNVYVKIPITTTKKESTLPLVGQLSQDGIKVNVTAVMTWKQILKSMWSMRDGAPGYVSVFAGRIADTGRDPLELMKMAVRCARYYPNVEVIWASPRELLNIFQANAISCHIITATNDILKKLPLVGKDLGKYSLETVKMFYNDAKASGYTL